MPKGKAAFQRDLDSLEEWAHKHLEFPQEQTQSPVPSTD